MLVVTIRNKFLPVTDRDPVKVEKYRHAKQGEPALNCRLHMTADAALTFNDMLRNGEPSRVDHGIASIITYTIED